jgi:hypothetical protein
VGWHDAKKMNHKDHEGHKEHRGFGVKLTFAFVWLCFLCDKIFIAAGRMLAFAVTRR